MEYSLHSLDLPLSCPGLGRLILDLLPHSETVLELLGQVGLGRNQQDVLQILVDLANVALVHVTVKEDKKILDHL